MDAYVYQAALLCEDCAAKVKADLDQHRDCDTDPPDDSESYPQGPHQDGGGEADSPCHCDHCETFLENPLTADGAAWLAEAFQAFILNGTGNPEVIEDWWGFYDYSASDLSFDDLIRARLESLPCREHDDCRAHPLIGFACKQRGHEHATDDLVRPPLPAPEAPSEPPKVAWRPVASPPPAVDEYGNSAEVLIFMPNGAIRVGERWSDGDDAKWVSGSDSLTVHPTHWAPLPEGPAGQQLLAPPDAIGAWWALAVLANNAFPGIGGAYDAIYHASMTDPAARREGGPMASTHWVLSHLAGMRYPKRAAGGSAFDSLLQAMHAAKVLSDADIEQALAQRVA